MSTDANKALVQAYLEALGRQEKTDELIDRFSTDPALKDHVFAFEAAFPNYALIADDLIAEGDKVAVRFHSTAVHQGEFMGIPATGKQVSATGLIIYRVADDKIAEHWLQVDLLGLRGQLQEPVAVAS